MADPRLTDEQVQQFHDDGYIVLPKLYSHAEMDLLLRIGKADRQLTAEATGRKDSQGGVSRLALRNHLADDDIYSAIVRDERIVRPMEQVLGAEVYHWHHKMMLKEPRVGGAWEWHQDYGYWYQNNHVLWPDMASCLIAVDRATKENGCLQVIRGSHKCGRFEHGVTGEQTGADLEKVDALLERLELVYCELEPGDAVIFHSNTLHRSDQNTSDNPRWSLICCYNTKHNDPYVEVAVGHPNYAPLEVWPSAKVAEMGEKHIARIENELGQTTGA